MVTPIQQSANIHTLPDERLLQIALQLDLPSLIQFSRTSRREHSIFEDKKIWELWKERRSDKTSKSIQGVIAKTTKQFHQTHFISNSLKNNTLTEEALDLYIAVKGEIEGDELSEYFCSLSNEQIPNFKLVSKLLENIKKKNQESFVDTRFSWEVCSIINHLIDNSDLTINKKVNLINQILQFGNSYNEKFIDQMPYFNDYFLYKYAMRIDGNEFNKLIRRDIPIEIMKLIINNGSFDGHFTNSIRNYVSENYAEGQALNKKMLERRKNYEISRIISKVNKIICAGLIHISVITFFIIALITFIVWCPIVICIGLCICPPDLDRISPITTNSI